MSNILSFFKSFQTKTKNKCKESVNGIKQKTTIDSDVKCKPNGLKTTLKSNENICDMKTTKAEDIRKQSEEKNGYIELVGNYFKKDVKKTNEEVLPIPPQRKHSKVSMKSINTTNTSVTKDLNSIKDLNKNTKQVLKRNKLDMSLDSITEINGNQVLKNDEKLLKSENLFHENKKKNEENTKTEDNGKSNVSDKHTIDLRTPKSFDPIINQLVVSESSVSLLAFDKSQEKQKENSGLVPIRDIDLNVAKCLICNHLVTTNINITICCHIFCEPCLSQWIRYSEHCPKCHQFISSFGHSIRTLSNKICIRSEKDYKVFKVSENEETFVDSLSASYLFEAFLINREVSQYLDSSISQIYAKISDLETNLLTNGSVQRNVNIRYKITEDIHRLEELKEKKRQLEERLIGIRKEINPQMFVFWEKVLILRNNTFD